MPHKPGEAIMKAQERERNRQYNRSRPARHKFYNTAQWRRLREYVIARQPLCAECLRQGRLTAGALVDHIIPIEEGGAEMDLENLQVLCAACHNKKHGEERGG